MNGYKLTREWFNFSCLNIDKVGSNHTAMYLYIVDFFNYNKWPDVIGLPTDWTMQKLGFKSYKTYKKTLDDLIFFDKIELVDKSRNNHTSNIIRLIEVVKNTNSSTNSSNKSMTISDTNSTTNSLLAYKNIETLNDKTLKLINDNATLVEQQIENWIKEEKLKTKVEIDFENLKNYWNSEFRNTEIKEINEITLKRKKSVIAVLNVYSKEQIKIVIQNIKDSSFLRGANNKKWIVTFNWVFIVDNFTKILEGNYENKLDTSKSIYG